MGPSAPSRVTLAFLRMRSFASSSTLFAAGMLAWGCAVYDTEMLPATGGLSGDGASSGSGGSGNKAGASTDAGSSSTTAGKSPVGGSDAMAEGGAPSSGGTDTVPSEAGSDGEAGDGATGNGGVAQGGTAGKGGTGAAGKGGSGGSGGTPIACADHPIPLKATWVATASDSSLGDGMETDGLFNPPAHMVDGKYNERWASGKAQSGDEWIQIDFGVVVNLSQLTLNVNNDTGDYPRAYAIRLSNTTQDFAATVRASGEGMPGNTVVNLTSPITGRYLTVRQTGMNPVDVSSWWTIAEVLVGCVDD